MPDTQTHRQTQGHGIYRAKRSLRGYKTQKFNVGVLCFCRVNRLLTSLLFSILFAQTTRDAIMPVKMKLWVQVTNYTLQVDRSTRTTKIWFVEPKGHVYVKYSHDRLHAVAISMGVAFSPYLRGCGPETYLISFARLYTSPLISWRSFVEIG